MGIALCCVWAAYTISELPQGMASAAAPPEVAAHAAEPPQAVGLASAPCKVVAPSNVLSACHVTFKETVTELHLPPDVTTVEPPEVAALAAEPPEVSVVSSSESLSCPVTAMEAVCESFSCPATATEAAYVSSSCPAMAMEAIYESSSCPVTAMEATYEPSTCPATAPETMKALPVLSVSALPVLFVLVLLRFQILSWFPAQSASLRWSAAPPWRSVARVWWSSAQVWGSPAPPWWALVPSAPPWWALVPSAPPWWAMVPSAPPWWALVPAVPPWWASVPSAPPWWAPVPSCLPWLPALPQSTASPLAHGPGPPFLPLFRLCSTTLLDSVMFGASGSRSLGGGGGAMSRILAMNFRPIATRGHLCTTLTHTPHHWHITLDCISHHPFVLTKHSWFH